MNTCCPTCSAPTAIGNDIAAVCSDCATVSLASSSISIIALIAAASTIAACIMTAKLVRHTFAAPATPFRAS